MNTEQELRSYVANKIGRKLLKKKLSYRKFAKEMGTSVSQVQRLLMKTPGEYGVNLATILKAAQVLGMKVRITIN